MVLFDLPHSEIDAQAIMNADTNPVALVRTVSQQKSRLPNCIARASKQYRISKYLLISIQKTENGPIGITYHKKYGTTDFGPFQINKETWLNAFQEQYPTYSWVNLAYDACINTFVATAILDNEIKKAKGDVWEAVGNYHHAKSSNMVRHYNYTTKVMTYYLDMVGAKLSEL